MRRSDRAVEAIGGRAPWILRGMARFTPATHAAEQLEEKRPTSQARPRPD